MKHLAAFLFLLFIATNSHAQLAIDNLALLPALKTGTTYVAFADPDDDENYFIDVCKQSWTISTLKFIPFSELKKHYMEPNASFLTVNFAKIPPYSNSIMGVGFLSLDFWTCDQGPKAQKRLSKADYMLLEDVKIIANYPIYIMPITTAAYVLPGEQMYCMPWDVYGQKSTDLKDITYYTKTWGAGVYKNMLQEMDRKITEGAEFKIHRGGFSTGEISALKSDTLFIPITVMSRKLAAELPSEKDQKNILGKYPYIFKVISDDDLDTMILERDKPFYYLKYHRDHKYYLVSIINSENGKTIYFESRVKLDGTYNFEDSEMGAIANVIKKS